MIINKLNLLKYCFNGNLSKLISTKTNNHTIMSTIIYYSFCKQKRQIQNQLSINILSKNNIKIKGKTLNQTQLVSLYTQLPKINKDELMKIRQIVQISLISLEKQPQLNNQNLYIILKLFKTFPSKLPKKIIKQYIGLIALMDPKSLKYQLQNIIQLSQQCKKQIINTLIIYYMQQKRIQEFILCLIQIGQLFQKKNIKSIDQFCYNNIHTLAQQEIISLVAIFNKLSIYGLYIQKIDVEFLNYCKCFEIQNCLKISINLLQLGGNEHFEQFQQLILKKPKAITNKKQLLIQLMHKYKLGTLKIWQYYYNLYQKQIPSMLLFPFIAGFYRNYVFKTKQFKQFIEMDTKLSYANTFTLQMFVEFFLIFYENAMRLDNKTKFQYLQFANSALKQTSIKGKQQCIKYFYQFLFDTSGNKRQQMQFLKRAKLSIEQCELLSLQFEGIQQISQQNKNKYETDLKQQYGQKNYSTNKRKIVIEEFIKIKLQSFQQKQQK